jgi:hypothetical protein
VDPDFLNEDWDEDAGDESLPPAAGKLVQTGSQVDSNWLDEDFDD